MVFLRGAFTCGVVAIAAASCGSGGGADWVVDATPGSSGGETGTSTTPEAAAPESNPPIPEAGAPETAPLESGASGGGAADASEDTAGWTLVWSDEFNLPDGSPVDPSKWNTETGGNGEGNKELEYYTSGTENAVIMGGNLVITARTDDAAQYQCWYGTCQYTSARLDTAGNFSQEYGRIEASIQIPSGSGDWPAFWMLGNNIGQAGWPACGEIDILESINVATTAYGSLHSNGFNASQGYTPPNMATLDGAFHTYAIEWDAQSITFLVDDQAYETVTSSDATMQGGEWPFGQQPFFIILNFAVGGNWPGSPDGSATFPQTMKVDWVRAYTRNP